MLLILILVTILDAYTTGYIAAFPSKIVEEFLSNYSVNEANSIMALSIGIATIGMYFVFINQYLADKLGRKFMLFITTLGMGISALLFSLSQNIIQFTIF
jgi:MFS family permease